MLLKKAKKALYAIYRKYDQEEQSCTKYDVIRYARRKIIASQNGIKATKKTIMKKMKKTTSVKGKEAKN